MNRQTALLLVAIVLFGVNLLKPNATADEQNAESPQPASLPFMINGRYELTTTGSGSAYFVIDTRTGAVWHAHSSSQKLRPISPPISE